MEVKYQFGYPINKRILMIADALDNPITFETQYEEYRGKYRPLKIVEVPIELLVYRIENIRTKSLQKQWLVTHPECEKNFFSVDSESIEVQEAQHQILQSLANKEGLLNAFKNGNLQQKEQEGIVYHISRGDDEISTPTHFSISEAGRARCNTIGIKYMMIAHRGTNTYLFKNINSNEYKAVFNDTLSGIEIWNTVLIQRAIDEVLLKERKRNPDIREILIYGKDYLSYLIFNKMWRKISKTDIIEIKDHNKEEIRTYALSIAQKLSPYVKNIDKTTRNIFQNGSDIEKIHAQIKNII